MRTRNCASDVICSQLSQKRWSTVSLELMKAVVNKNGFLQHYIARINFSSLHFPFARSLLYFMSHDMGNFDLIWLDSTAETQMDVVCARECVNIETKVCALAWVAIEFSAGPDSSQRQYERDIPMYANVIGSNSHGIRNVKWKSAVAPWTLLSIYVHGNVLYLNSRPTTFIQWHTLMAYEVDTNEFLFFFHKTGQALMCSVKSAVC